MGMPIFWLQLNELTGPWRRQDFSGQFQRSRDPARRGNRATRSTDECVRLNGKTLAGPPKPRTGPGYFRSVAATASQLHAAQLASQISDLQSKQSAEIMTAMMAGHKLATDAAAGNPLRGA